MLKILVSSANIYTSDSMLYGKSFMYSTNKIGPSTLPCGMPLTSHPKAPLYNIIIIVDTVVIGRNEILNTKNNYDQQYRHIAT